jgi:DNA-binding GntR family transcriptional regulator
LEPPLLRWHRRPSIEQLFVYREVLEVAAIRLGGRTASEADLTAMEALLDAVGPGATPEQAHQAGQEFHVRIAQLSGNAFISRGVADAMTRLSRVRWLESDPAHHGWDEHRAVLAALREGDVSRAADLIAAHTRETRDRLLAELKGHRRTLRARGAIIRGA